MFFISYQSQDGLHLVRWASHVFDWIIPAYDEYRSWGPRLSPHAKVVFPPTNLFGLRPQLSFNPAPLLQRNIQVFNPKLRAYEQAPSKSS